MKEFVEQRLLEADEAHRKCNAENTDENKEVWKQALGNLYQVNDQIHVKEQALEQEISNIESSHGAQKYGEAWKTVNEITGRKKAKEGQISGASPEERV